MWFLLPAAVMVTLFYVVPVVLTSVFSFTSMSADTGILGARYVISDATLRRLRETDLDRALVERLGQRVFVFDAAGLRALAAAGTDARLLADIRTWLAGRRFESRRALFRALARLPHRPRSFRERKGVADRVLQTVHEREFTDPSALETALLDLGIRADEREMALILEAADTSWRWTLANYRELLASQFTVKILANTGYYVALTLLFNVGLALLLALVTFYMPATPAKLFRAVWLIPRMMPSVIYVLLWKWFTYDSGFLSQVLGLAGVPPQNYLLEYPWTFVVIINGCVGASMGLIIFSSAMHAIPKSLLHAAEVDGAYPLQQVRRIILPQLRWPILFVTCYQTMSLLTSFEYILLTTDGGPGFYTTEVWALHAFHAALSNYFGNFRYGFGAALSLVLVALGVGLSVLYLKLFGFRRLLSAPPIGR